MYLCACFVEYVFPYSDSIDKIFLFQGREHAEAVVLDSKIFFCGGFNRNTSPTVTNSCYSFTMGQDRSTWMTEQSMQVARNYFGLSVVGGTIYATGGESRYEDDQTYSSVESYTEERGWRIENSMEMTQEREGHCSVALKTRLLVIGGSVQSSVFDTVQAFDTENLSQGWVSLRSMTIGRSGHACQAALYQGEEGIFVSGGRNDASASVEFYRPESDTWANIASLNIGRQYHSMTVASDQLVVAGGDTEGAGWSSVEMFNGSHWLVTTHLLEGRRNHAAVSVPSTFYSC